LQFYSWVDLHMAVGAKKPFGEASHSRPIRADGAAWSNTGGAHDWMQKRPRERGFAAAPRSDLNASL